MMQDHTDAELGAGPWIVCGLIVVSFILCTATPPLLGSLLHRYLNVQAILTVLDTKSPSCSGM